MQAGVAACMPVAELATDQERFSGTGVGVVGQDQGPGTLDGNP
jgi:hypothetical protein